MAKVALRPAGFAWFFAKTNQKPCPWAPRGPDCAGGMKTKTTTNVRAQHPSTAAPTASEGSPVHRKSDPDQQEPALYPDLEGFIPEAYCTIQDPPA
ncbi:MAG: hypothetical protein AAGB22_14700, partial [Bacteroidota bacterium]